MLHKLSFITVINQLYTYLLSLENGGFQKLQYDQNSQTKASLALWINFLNPYKDAIEIDL